MNPDNSDFQYNEYRRPSMTYRDPRLFSTDPKVLAAQTAQRDAQVMKNTKIAGLFASFLQQITAFTSILVIFVGAFVVIEKMGGPGAISAETTLTLQILLGTAVFMTGVLFLSAWVCGLRLVWNYAGLTRGILYSILLLIPVINIILLIAICYKSTEILENAGIPVGIFGPSRKSIKAYNQRKSSHTAKKHNTHPVITGARLPVAAS